jgi:hypothetical protein
MRQQSLVKINQSIVANLGNRLTIARDWRLDLVNFPFAIEPHMN